MTISAGFSVADLSVLPQEIISRADRALYEAKRDGRNLVYDYGYLIEKGVLQEIATESVDLW